MADPSAMSLVNVRVWFGDPMRTQSPDFSVIGWMETPWDGKITAVIIIIFQHLCHVLFMLSDMCSSFSINSFYSDSSQWLPTNTPSDLLIVYILCIVLFFEDESPHPHPQKVNCDCLFVVHVRQISRNCLRNNSCTISLWYSGMFVFFFLEPKLSGDTGIVENAFADSSAYQCSSLTFCCMPLWSEKRTSLLPGASCKGSSHLQLLQKAFTALVFMLLQVKRVGCLLHTTLFVFLFTVFLKWLPQTYFHPSARS